MGIGDSGNWDQEAFDRADRRSAKRELAAEGGKRHDLLRLDFAAANSAAVHAIVHAGTRQVDALHTHEGALVLTCPPHDAGGLRSKLEGLFKAKKLAVELSQGTFSAGSDIGKNLAGLKS